MCNSIAIVTDTNSGMTLEQAKNLGVTIIPMPFYINGELYFEGVNLDADGFYKHLADNSEVNTSQPAPGDVMRIWDELLKEKEEIISNVCSNLKTKEDSLSQKVTSLIEENKSLSKELHDMKTKMSLQAVDSVLDSKLDVNGVNLVTTKFEGMDMNTLKEVADNLRDKLVSGVVVLANTTDDKLNLVATATKDAVDKGVHCGNIVKSIAQIAGGKGGGRPNMAQAGAPDVSKVDEALNHASEVLKSQVK